MNTTVLNYWYFTVMIIITCSLPTCRTRLDRTTSQIQFVPMFSLSCWVWSRKKLIRAAFYCSEDSDSGPIVILYFQTFTYCSSILGGIQKWIGLLIDAVKMYVCVARSSMMFAFFKNVINLNCRPPVAGGTSCLVALLHCSQALYIITAVCPQVVAATITRHLSWPKQAIWTWLTVLSEQTNFRKASHNSYWNPHDRCKLRRSIPLSSSMHRKQWFPYFMKLCVQYGYSVCVGG